jgi:hypothetical protein
MDMISPDNGMRYSLEGVEKIWWNPGGMGVKSLE